MAETLRCERISRKLAGREPTRPPAVVDGRALNEECSLWHGLRRLARWASEGRATCAECEPELKRNR